jgi:Lipocalin-like domain
MIRSKLALSIVFITLLTVDTFFAHAQTPSSALLGTWKVVLVDNIQLDGTRVQPYGPNPQGILTFDSAGNYALQIMRADRPKFAANDKSKGTPEEYAAAVQGTNTHFGRYSISEDGHFITFHIEHASFPNWEGTDQKRSFTLIGDDLTYTVPTPTTGAKATGEVKWKRAR